MKGQTMDGSEPRQCLFWDRDHITTVYLYHFWRRHVEKCLSSWYPLQAVVRTKKRTWANISSFNLINIYFLWQMWECECSIQFSDENWMNILNIRDITSMFVCVCVVTFDYIIILLNTHLCNLSTKINLGNSCKLIFITLLDCIPNKFTLLGASKIKWKHKQIKRVIYCFLVNGNIVLI